MRNLAGSVVVMLLGFVFTIVGMQAVAGSNSEAPDPFFFNADNYLGQPVSTIEEYGFSCSDIEGYYEPHHLHCIPQVASDSYSEVRVATSAGVVREIAFTMRNDATRIGHLILSWGNPEVRSYNRSIHFYWHGGRISAVALRETALFSPSLPVWKVYFFGASTQI